MLDIIIPSYNNEKGLYDTLFSLGTRNFDFQVTIIDDCSTIKIDYDKIIKIFEQFYPIQVLYNETNIGPGNTRQKGINSTTNDYILFIDCGDLITAPSLLKIYTSFFEQAPQLDYITPACYIEWDDGTTHLLGWMNNRMAGKFYRRNFLKKNKIKFNPDCSYINEDVTFNKECRLICKLKYNDANIFTTDDRPLITATYDHNSITKSNDEAYFFEKQNYGATQGILYLIQELTKNHGITLKELKEEIYEIFVYMYMSYLNCITTKPQFAQKSFEDILPFYRKYASFIKQDEQALAYKHAELLIQACQNFEPFAYNLNIITLKDFIKELDKEIIKNG